MDPRKWVIFGGEKDPEKGPILDKKFKYFTSESFSPTRHHKMNLDVPQNQPTLQVPSFRMEHSCENDDKQ